MTRACPRRVRRTAGFTLLEMLLSMSVLTVCFAAVGSVFVMAGHVMPRPDSAEAASVEQSAALGQIVEDLQTARYITGGSANSVTFVVDDRTGDGLPERITYAWSGVAGDPLTYTLNDAPRVTIAEGVRAFSIAAETEERVDRVPLVSTTSDEQLLVGYTNPTTAATASITSEWHLGQLFRPQLPANATAYTITRLRARARQNGTTSGSILVQLRGFSEDTQTLLPVDSQLRAYESQLASTYTWTDFTFSRPPSYASDATAAITIDWEAGNVPADFEYDDAGGQDILWSTDGGSNYTRYDGKGMLAEVYGTVLTQMPGVELTRTVYTLAQVTLKIGAAPVQSASARLFCEPGVHAAVWDAGFDASPVGIDLDGDGADWAAQSGGAAGSFSNGQWDVDGKLYTQPTHSFDQPMVIDLAMGATAANRGGAAFQINADQQGGTAVPLTVRVGRDSAGDYCVKVYDTESLTTPRLDLTGLGDRAPEVRLLVVPADDTVGVIVNGQPAGSFTYTPVAAGGLPGLATLSEASSGFFDDVSIRLGAEAVVTHPDGSTNNSGNDGGSGGGLIGGLVNGLLG